MVVVGDPDRTMKGGMNSSLEREGLYVVGLNKPLAAKHLQACVTALSSMEVTLENCATECKEKQKYTS